MYACATLQNLCHDPGWSQIVVAHGLQPRIEELATTSEDPLLVRRPPPRLAAASRARPLLPSLTFPPFLRLFLPCTLFCVTASS